jgi:hypothetical protein
MNSRTSRSSSGSNIYGSDSNIRKGGTDTHGSNSSSSSSISYRTGLGNTSSSSSSHNSGSSTRTTSIVSSSNSDGGRSRMSSSDSSSNSSNSSSTSSISGRRSNRNSNSSSRGGCGIDCPFARLRTQCCSPSASYSDAVFEERIEAALDDHALAWTPTSSHTRTHPSTSMSINSNSSIIDKYAGQIGPSNSASAHSSRSGSSSTERSCGIDCPFERLRAKYCSPPVSSQQLDEATVFEEQIETALEALEASESAMEAGRIALAWSWCVASRSSTSSSFEFIHILDPPFIQTCTHPCSSIQIYHPPNDVCLSVYPQT